MTLGNVIRERRKELNMTQEDLANKVNTTKATVSRWESGDIHKMKRPIIQKLAKALDLDPMIFVQHQEILLPEEMKVVNAYRVAKDEIRTAVKKLLDIN